MRQHDKGSERSPQDAQQIDRRRLLTGAGLALGAAGASAVSLATPSAASEPQAPQHNGYRESEHVKTYYRLASF